MRSVEDCVLEALFDIMREIEREEALRLFRMMVGQLTRDAEISQGISTVLKRRIEAAE